MQKTKNSDQIEPKSGTQYTPETLSKLSLEELVALRDKIKRRIDQRGSSRPVTYAKTHMDNKNTEREYYKLIQDMIAAKTTNETVETVKTFEDFISESKSSRKKEIKKEDNVNSLKQIYDWVKEDKIDMEEFVELLKANREGLED